MSAILPPVQEQADRRDRAGMVVDPRAERVRTVRPPFPDGPRG